MLVLTRRIGEAILVGNNGDIDIKILGITKSQVKLGIKAPKHISVHREEVYHNIVQTKNLQEQQESANEAI